MPESSAEQRLLSIKDQALENPTTSAADFSVALALLLLARLTDAKNRSTETIDGRDIRSTLSWVPQWSTWTEFSNLEEMDQFVWQLPETLRSRDSLDLADATVHVSEVYSVAKCFSRVSAELLLQLIKWISDQPISLQSDLLALRSIFDHVLVDTHSKSVAQFITPFHIADMMARLANPGEGNTLHDPCLGVAGLLTASLDFVRHLRTNSESSSSQDITFETLRISGFENNPVAFVIALTRLALSGVAEPTVRLGDGLNSASTDSSGVDIAVANPPWGIRIEHDSIEELPIPTNESSSLFLQRAVLSLKPGGRAVVVLPPGLLFRGGRDQQLRKWLLLENTVEAVLSLPAGAFSPQTSIETCVIVVRRGGTTNKVRMVNADSLFRKEQVGLRSIDQTQLSRLMDAEVCSETAGPDSVDIRIEQLEENEYDLTPKPHTHVKSLHYIERHRRTGDLKLLGDYCKVLGGLSIQPANLIDFSARYITLDAAADFLGMTSDELKRVSIRGDIRGYQDQNTWLFRPGDLTDFSRVNNEGHQRLSPYIKTKNVDHGRVSHITTWIKSEALPQIESEKRLLVNDVLVSGSLSTARMGLVDNAHKAGVVASGLYVLRVKTEQLDPQYLMAILSSEECTAWLEMSKRGGAIKQLAAKDFERLPIPIPGIEIQRQLVRDHKKYNSDMMTCLNDYHNEGLSNSFAFDQDEWLKSMIGHLRYFRTISNIDDLFNELHELADLKPPANYCESCEQPFLVDHSSDNYDFIWEYYCPACLNDEGPGTDTLDTLDDRSPITGWIFAYRQAIIPLEHLTDVSETTSVVTLLQATKANLSDSLSHLGEKLAIEKRARDMCFLFIDAIDHLNQQLNDDIRVEVRFAAASIDQNGKKRLRFSLENVGKAPILGATISAPSGLQATTHVRISYFDPGDIHKFEFEDDGHANTDDLVTSASEELSRFNIYWDGRNLKGDRVDGECELNVRFGEPAPPGDRVIELPNSPLPNSPYITGKPVKADRSDVFFGRDLLLDNIRNQIGHSGNVVLLEGNRRTGKSSILWHLEGREATPGWLGVYISFQGFEGSHIAGSKGIPTVEVFRSIAIETAKSIQRIIGCVLLPDGSELVKGKPGIARPIRMAIQEEAPFSMFQEYIELLLNWLEARDLRLLLLFDEFDKLQEGIESGVTSPQVPENLRHLIQSDSRITAVLACVKLFRKLREDYFSVLYGFGTPFDVTSLAKSDARALVTKPIRNLLTYTPAAVEKAVSLTAGQPYLLQCLCDVVYQKARQTDVRSIDVGQIDVAAQEVLKHRHFNDLFKYAGTDLNRFLLALCHREAEREQLRLMVLREILSANGVELSVDTLAKEIERLTELELLRFSGQLRGGTYSLAFPLMGMWIDTLDFEALKLKARAETADLGP